LPAGSTRLTNGAAGVLFYNNTILSETVVAAASNVHWRNNLMLGQNSGPTIFGVNTFTNYSSSDYNGFRPNPGAAVSFRWSSPPSAVAADFAGPGHTPRIETREFAALADYANLTGQDRHSVVVDYDIFMNVRQLDAEDAATVQKLHKASDFDFRLKPGSPAVDRGLVLSNVTDGFTGRAPDLGALEVDTPAPKYGPRSSNSKLQTEN
jgi:hypothetical protein